MSPKTKQGLLSLLKGSALAAGGAALVYASAHLGEVDWGAWGPAAAAVASALLNLARKVVAACAEGPEPPSPAGEDAG